MQSRYENYPAGIIALANFVSLSIYAIGLLIIAQLGIVWAILYLAFCVWIEISLYRGSCVNCYYYGKFCALGRGKICALLFRKGDPMKFISRRPTWRDILPEILVSLIPLVAGVIVLVQHFSWPVAGAMAAILILAFAGNGLVRSSFACTHCKQRDLGCPAAQLFSQAGK